MEDEMSTVHQTEESGFLDDEGFGQGEVSSSKNDHFQETHGKDNEDSDEIGKENMNKDTKTGMENGDVEYEHTEEELVNVCVGSLPSDSEAGLLQNISDTKNTVEEEKVEDELTPPCSESVTASGNEDVTEPDTEKTTVTDNVEEEGADEELEESGACFSASDTVHVEQDDGKASSEWLDILGNGLLMKKVLRPGKGKDSRPTRGQEVLLKASGALEDGTPVDCHDQISLILGDGDIIQAWDICISLMELGEVCELKSDSKYCYSTFGSTDSDPVIPPDSNLTYVLELVEVKDGPDIEKISEEERISLGEKKRLHGNKLYSRGDYSAAIIVYSRALKYLEPSLSEDVMNLKLVCWNNLAACQLKIKAYQAAHNSCLQVLNIEPNNVKALYRRGKVLSLQGEFDEAVVYIKKASLLDPTNKAVTTELNNLKKRQANQLKKEKDMYQRMVAGMKDDKKADKNSKSSIFNWQVLLGATIVAVGGILVALLISKHQ